ncbi:MAG: glycosyl transferase family 2 [Bacteroidetes bacterium 4572_128]|nr:MAG: glycosyl transferase family 2 [Bacteroidetes bacterium 4572_128]
MISIDQISVDFGNFQLFDNLNFLINEKDSIGLVGKNGAGKSTLLKIIAGVGKANSGFINKSENLEIAYLPQEMILVDGRTVLEEAKTLKLIDKFTSINDRFNFLDGGNIDKKTEQILKGLGFIESDFNRPTLEFSGGWRMRIELAKILLKNPDILLLDEPTNHLDIESIQWLEDFLKYYSGAILLVSHDRQFLDSVTKRTLEISMGQIHDYKVPYSKYVFLRKERREQQKAAYENQQKMIKDTKKFIERFRYKSTKSVQVQSRIKQLNKLKIIKIDEVDNRNLHFNFIDAPRSGSVVIETKNLSKNYGEHLVLENINLIIERGEKIAFVGRNGEGKTTLSRIILNEIDFEGVLKTGHNVNIGYLAQNQDNSFYKNRTVFQTLDDIAVGEVRKKIRNILGAFLFSGEDAEKKTSVLSGGERSRLAIAKLLLKPYNLLILDEPTNHLDMLSKEILKKALIKYNGTLIIVSHDRDFLNGLTPVIYEFKNKKIKQHQNGIYDFLEKKKMKNLREIEIKDRIVKKKNNKTSLQKNIYFSRKEKEKEIRRIKNKIKKSENKIDSLEKEQEKQNEDFYIKYKNLNKTLDKEMNIWGNLITILDKKNI